VIDLAEVTHVYLAREPVDFRRQIDGLSLHVQEVLALDPFAPQVFVFRNRRGDKLKALTWHGNGFCLLYKRLERGRFPWPRMESAVFTCRLRELQWLLEGCDITALPRQKKLTFSRI
jgi:transposase